MKSTQGLKFIAKLPMNLEVKCADTYSNKATTCWYLILSVICLTPFFARGEDTFPVLNAGSETYSNVTVTSKTPRYVLITHARGMTTLKLKDLPIDTLRQLGYEVEEPKPQKSLAQRIELDSRITA